MLKAWLLPVLAWAVLGGAAGAARADEVTLDQVSPAARAVIERETRGGRIEEIERERKNGRIVYEVEYVRDGREREIHVAEDGTLLERDDD